MVSFSQPGNFQSRPKLRRLQDVQEDIYRQLQLLLPDEISFFDQLISKVPGSPLLRLHVLERHNYTTFFRLTYEFKGNERVSFAPDAHIRFYHDARLAEAVSFDCTQACNRTSFPDFPIRQAMQKTWRQNKALDRWLEYLLRQGHSVETLKGCHDTPLVSAKKPEVMSVS